MGHHSTNGNGGAVTILPPATQVITGASLAHRQLDKRQRAVLVVGVREGTVRFTPTMAQLALLFNVSTTYVLAASKLSPGERSAIMQGYEVTRFADLLRPPRQLSLAMPVIPTVKVISDTELQDLVRCVGTERLINAAVAVERAA
jgi:hypothetical protein